MESIYTHCIFCGNELPPPNQRGDGEHIIPEFIYGTVKIKDVCIGCNGKFGTEVDTLILEDARIINAINELDESEELKHKIRMRAKIQAKDTETGNKVEIKATKNGKFRVKTLYDNGVLNIDEGNLKNHILGLTKKDPRLENVDYIVDSNIEQYKKLSPGEKLSVPELGRTLRRGSFYNAQIEYKTRTHAAARLISKICVEFCLSFIMQLFGFDFKAFSGVLNDLEYHRKIARGLMDIEQYKIMCRPKNHSNPSKSDYVHRVQFQVLYESIIAIDIDLFNRVNYRIILNNRDKIVLPEIEGRRCFGFGIGNTFKPSEPKQKHCAFFFEDKIEKFLCNI